MSFKPDWYRIEYHSLAKEGGEVWTGMSGGNLGVVVGCLKEI